MWEQEWGGPAYFSNGSSSSRGVAILMSRNLQVKILNTKTDQERRLLCMDIEIGGILYTLGSLYAPTQDKGREQLEYLELIDRTLSEMA